MVMFTFVGWEGSSKIIGQTCRNAEMVAIRFLTGFLWFLQAIKHESKNGVLKKCMLYILMFISIFFLSLIALCRKWVNKKEFRLRSVLYKNSGSKPFVLFLIFVSFVVNSTSNAFLMLYCIIIPIKITLRT